MTSGSCASPLTIGNGYVRFMRFSLSHLQEMILLGPPSDLQLSTTPREGILINL